jgi:hypothetical protein
VPPIPQQAPQQAQPPPQQQQQQQLQQQPQGTPTQPPPPAPASSSVPGDQLVCQWQNCGERCASAEQLYVSKPTFLDNSERG